MPYLFQPPARLQQNVFPGTRSLIFKFYVSLTVWHDGDGWHSMECPPAETLEAADTVLAGRNQIIDDTTAASLIAAGVGTCTPIEA